MSCGCGLTPQAIKMAGKNELIKPEEYVYRISTEKEWEALQSNGSILGGELDKSTGCIHLSNLNQVIHTHTHIYHIHMCIDYDTRVNF